jgi:hypothetical protein
VWLYDLPACVRSLVVIGERQYTCGRVRLSAGAELATFLNFLFHSPIPQPSTLNPQPSTLNQVFKSSDTSSPATVPCDLGFDCLRVSELATFHNFCFIPLNPQPSTLNQVFKSSDTSSPATVSSWIHLVVLVLAAVMNQSAIDSLISVRPLSLYYTFCMSVHFTTRLLHTLLHDPVHLHNSVHLVPGHVLPRDRLIMDPSGGPYPRGRHEPVRHRLPHLGNSPSHFTTRFARD